MNSALSMLKVLTLGMLATVVATEAVSQEPKLSQKPKGATVVASKEEIESTIRILSGEWSKAMLQRDETTLERIWATDFIYVEPSGRRFNKAEGIADMKKSTEKLTSAAASSIDVRVYGGGTVVVDIGDYKQVGQDKNGKPFDRLSRFTNVWILKDQQWQCVSGHASNVPPKP